MTHQQFHELLGEVLAIEVPLTGNETLKDLDGWDSLAVVSFMAMVHENYGVQVAPKDMRSCNTVNDLMALVCPTVENDPEHR